MSGLSWLSSILTKIICLNSVRRHMAAAQRSHGLALGEDFRLVSDPENSPRGFLEAHGGAELSHSEHVPYDISTAAHMSKPAGHVVFDRSGSSKSGAAVVQGIHSAGSSPMPVVSTNLVQAGPSAGRLSFIRCQFSHTLSRDGAVRLYCDVDVSHFDHNLITQQPLLGLAQPSSPRQAWQ